MSAELYTNYQGGYYVSNDDDKRMHVEPIEDAIYDEEDHLASSNVYGKTTSTFVMTIRGSLEEFANHPERAVWTVPSESHRLLQKITSRVNRSKATDAERTGDVSRSILLNATVTALQNQFPIALGVDIHGLVPDHITSTGCHNLVLLPNTAAPTMSKSVFKPDSILSENDYVKYSKMTPETLAREITFHDEKEEEPYANIRVGGIAWDVLLRNAANDKFDEDTTKQLQMIASSLTPFTREVSIPSEIGRELQSKIGAPLKDIEKSFVDMRLMGARFLPAYGGDWNSYAPLIGESAGMNADDSQALVGHLLNTPYTATVELTVEHIAFTK